MKNSLVKWNRNRSLFDELSESIFNDTWSDPMFSLTRNWRPQFCKETDKDYQLEIEIPRVRKEEVKVEAVDNNTVRVTANNKNLQYSREFYFSDCDAEKAEVKLDAGVLYVTVPRTIPPLPKTKVLEIKEVDIKTLTNVNC